ncbi:hypothetical protein PN480_10015 [Dolichospermum circinale CS-1225]|uniref:hypothetical protein n=1 Tax=Dolichospermum circinale TaxID=109265 RepID=UPI002330456C|nr:hypothetical protein [Dolichospermum circinale]MDB9522287.1 hypothetical protein [Dolichospermum circinale CS-1225]
MFKNGGGVVASLVSILALSAPARAITFGFTGDYAPSKWNLTNSNADGFVDTSNAPNSITLTGGNNGSGSFGRTTYSITNTQRVSFNWNYSTNDEVTYSDCAAIPGNFCDPFQIVLNGNATTLISNAGSPQSGTYTTLIPNGNTFGFSIATADNSFGRGSVTISNFSAAPVPFESNAAPAGMAIVFGAFMLRRRLQQRSA